MACHVVPAAFSTDWASILEVGLGTGSLWVENADRLPMVTRLVITDFSPRMLEVAGCIRFSPRNVMLPMLIEGDLTIPSPEPRRGRRLLLADNDPQTVIAVVSHGVWQGLHHVEAHESDDEVVVTAYVGTLRNIADRQANGEELTFVMKGVLRPIRITLAAPLGGRALRDGAPVDDRFGGRQPSNRPAPGPPTQ